MGWRPFCCSALQGTQCYQHLHLQLLPSPGAAPERCPEDFSASGGSTPPGPVALTEGPGGWLTSARCCGDGSGSVPVTAKRRAQSELWGSGCRDVPHTRGTDRETEAGNWVGVWKCSRCSPLGCSTATGGLLWLASVSLFPPPTPPPPFSLCERMDGFSSSWGTGVRVQWPGHQHPKVSQAGEHHSHPIAVGEHGVKEAVQVPVQTPLAAWLPKFPICEGTRHEPRAWQGFVTTLVDRSWGEQCPTMGVIRL